MKKKLIAMFTIMLVLSLPIYSSASLAAYVEVTSIHGNDNIEGLLADKDSDTLKVELKAYIDDGTAVSTGHLRYGGTGASPRSLTSPGLPMDGCAFGDSYYTCTLTQTSLAGFSNPHTLRFYLYDDDTNKVASTSAQVFFDENDPTIQSFTLTPAVISSGNLNIDLKVEDDACSSCGSMCSGIDYLELQVGSYTNTITIDTETCNHQEIIDVDLLTIEPDAASAVNKVVTATLTVYDKMGHSSSESKTIRIDTTIPTIQNLEVMHAGQSLDEIGPNPVTVEVSAEVAGDNLDLSSITADLSQLHESAPADYAGRPGTCTGNGVDSYICRWSGIIVSLSTPTTATITITASDTAGNSASVPLTKEIAYDATGPTVTSISTNRAESAGISYLGQGYNEITVSITEDGAGLATKQIYLDLSSINPALSDVQATTCTPGWECTFENVNPTIQGVKTIRVKDTSTDDLGNQITGTLEKTVAVDFSPPSYLSHTVTNIGTDIYEDIIKTGDSLLIEIVVSESNHLINAYADFSPIVDGAFQDMGLCDDVEGTDTWKCQWTTTPIDLSGDINADLDFYLTDAANNTLTYTVPIEVLGIDDAVTVPNYWTHTVDCSPNRFDREITPVIQTRSFCRINLIPNDPSSDIEPLSIDLEQCTDNEVPGSIAFIANAELLNDQQGSTEPFIKLTLAQAEATIEKIDIKCPLKIVSRAGSLITGRPETEEIEIELEFYNSPLGGVSDGIKDKIDDVEDINDGVWGWIGTLREILRYAEVGCKIWEIINNVWDILKGLAQIFGGVEATLEWFPPGHAAAKSARIAACGSSEVARDSASKAYQGLGNSGIAGSLSSLCNFVNCKVASGTTEDDCDNKKGLGGWGLKLGGSCGLIDMNKLPTAKIVSDYTGKDPNDYMSAKDSLILSLGTFCIPGIIYNLDKFRQVECMYGTCLLSIQDSSGVPISVCEAQKDYLFCKYVIGEIFHLIPLLSYANYLSNAARGVLGDPLGVIGVVLGYICMPECKGGETHWPWYGCAYIEMTSMIGQVVKDIMEMDDKGWALEQDYCELFEDLQDEYE